MTNLRVVSSRHPSDGEGPSPWRSFDSVVAGLLAQAQAQRAVEERSLEARTNPAAWAAE